MSTRSRLYCCTALLLVSGWGLSIHPASYNGFQEALWGMTPDQVKQAAKITAWTQVPGDSLFSSGLPVAIYATQTLVAGYSSTVRYYFFQERFFQATVIFDFAHLKEFDFNYNVFISVDKYYRTIRDQSVTFVNDIYSLLQKKYGKKQPVFKGLDPRYSFADLDRYVKQEIWNFRYYPYEYYRRIVTSSYALWNFPETRVIFSLAVSAKDKRFDYQLSLTSITLESIINSYKDSIRISGL